MFHSNQGSQYTSYDFRKSLRDLGVSRSFSKPGYPYDNAVVESFLSSLKREELNNYEFDEPEELHLCLEKYIEYYNDYRPHQSLDYKTPNSIEHEYYLNINNIENSTKKVLHYK